MIAHRTRLFRTSIVCAALTTVLLSGCAADPEPSPTPAALFATDDEAFAAAEETYRAYVAALNEVDLSDPGTFEPVYDLSTGELNAANRETFSQMHADDLTVTGDTRITLVQPSVEQPVDFPRTVWLDACFDVSEIDLTDESGKSVVDPSRPDIQTARLTIDASVARVSNIDGREDGPEC